jgi:hypothetical protein
LELVRRQNSHEKSHNQPSLLAASRWRSFRAENSFEEKIGDEELGERPVDEVKFLTVFGDETDTNDLIFGQIWIFEESLSLK